MTTVALNTEGYSKREIKRAHEARRFFHTIGRPSIADFKQAIRSNTFKNCKVTLDDVRIMEGLFGPDAASLKGKTTRTTPTPVVDDRIDLPLGL